MVSSRIIPAIIKRMDTIMHFETANIILYCKKWEETVAFYRSGLKLPVHACTEWFVEFILTDTSRLSVADESRTSIKSGGGRGVTIGLQVADITTARANLEDAGLNPTVVKEVWGAKVFYAFDPEGNRIEFWAGRARV